MKFIIITIVAVLTLFVLAILFNAANAQTLTITDDTGESTTYTCFELAGETFCE